MPEDAPLLEQIRSELRRIVGPAGVEASLEQSDLGQAVRIETSEAVRRVPPRGLLGRLRGVPDHAGPLALLECLDEWDGATS